jgi:hypothetical protein
MITTLLAIQRHSCFAALLCCSCLIYGQAANVPPIHRGVIEGTVINEKGQPVPHAQAFALPSGLTIAARRYVETDQNGRFRLDRMEWGTYHVFAKKISAGYADTGWSFYDNYPLVTVTISTSAPQAVVTVRIGPPCGLLNLAPVIDAVTAEPIKDYGVTLRRAADPHRFVSERGALNPLLIPSNTDVLVEVWAKGYESWPSKREGASGKIRLRPGQSLNLQVKLHRSTTSETK